MIISDEEQGQTTSRIAKVVIAPPTVLLTKLHQDETKRIAPILVGVDQVMEVLPPQSATTPAAEGMENGTATTTRVNAYYNDGIEESGLSARGGGCCIVCCCYMVFIFIIMMAVVYLS